MPDAHRQSPGILQLHPSLPPTRLLGLLHLASALGYRRLWLHVGETGLHLHLPELLEAARKLGMQTELLVSPGHTPARLRRVPHGLRLELRRRSLHELLRLSELAGPGARYAHLSCSPTQAPEPTELATAWAWLRARPPHYLPIRSDLAPRQQVLARWDAGLQSETLVGLVDRLVLRPDGRLAAWSGELAPSFGSLEELQDRFGELRAQLSEAHAWLRESSIPLLDPYATLARRSAALNESAAGSVEAGDAHPHRRRRADLEARAPENPGVVGL